MMLALADRFLPEGLVDPEVVRQKRTVVLGSALGLVFAAVTAAGYAALGSRWSAASISFITVGLGAAPFLVRRGVSTAAIGHVMTALTGQAALVVASRSGGLASPATVWLFMLPVIAYLSAGYSASLLWSGFSVLTVVGLFFADKAGVVFARDFPPESLALLRVSGYPGVFISTALILAMVEGVRVTSLAERDRANLALERERLLRDMHDGVGGHLMGLIVRARAQPLSGPELVQSLEACLDDLRLVVDSLDPEERSLEMALGELRQRALTHCEMAGIQLEWRCEAPSDLVLPGPQTLDVLRAGQEMLSNAFRHAHARHIDFTLALTGGALTISVRDDGVGLDSHQPKQRVGRGLQGLRARAQHLQGNFELRSAAPGTVATIRFPLERQDR